MNEILDMLVRPQPDATIAERIASVMAGARVPLPAAVIAAQADLAAVRAAMAMEIFDEPAPPATIMSGDLTAALDARQAQLVDHDQTRTFIAARRRAAGDLEPAARSAVATAVIAAYPEMLDTVIAQFNEAWPAFIAAPGAPRAAEQLDALWAARLVLGGETDAHGAGLTILDPDTAEPGIDVINRLNNWVRYPKRSYERWHQCMPPFDVHMVDQAGVHRRRQTLDEWWADRQRPQRRTVRQPPEPTAEHEPTATPDASTSRNRHPGNRTKTRSSQ